MKKEKQIKNLKEFIEKEIDLILLESGWLESNPLYRIFVQPFSDFASVVAGETRKMISAAWSALNQYVAIGAREFLALWNPERYGYTARSTIIGPDGQPTIVTGDQAFENLTGFNLQNYLTQEREGLTRHIGSINQEYADVYKRIDSNLNTGDVEGVLFLLNPGLYITAQTGRMATGVALDSASVLTGGRVPAVESLRNSYTQFSQNLGSRFSGRVSPGAWSGTSGMGAADDSGGSDVGIQLEQASRQTRQIDPQQIQQIEQQYKQRLEQILQQPNVQAIVNNQPAAIAAREYIANGIYENIVDDDLVKSKSFSEFQSKQPTVAGEISGNIKNLITTRFEEQAANQQEQAANQQEERPAQSTGTTSTSATTSTQSTSSTEEEPQQETQPIEVVMPTEEQLNQVVERSFQDARKAQKEVNVRQLESIANSSPELATALRTKISQVRSL